MTAVDSHPSLADVRVLIVEDEMMVAMMLEALLTELGCIVLMAGRVPKAVELITAEAIDVAILDVNVAGVAVYPVADELQKRGIPFIFSSGYGASGIASGYREHPTLTKPFQWGELAQTLVGALQSRLQ